ncbi:hypothetical protein BS50DRAFT_610358 [Corynespora cassiicola Philippines]|uniref:Cryptic loci regulator 2 N-terminal domain-containing protein n=1 Tax=Corynespora cassiicola Philippines TaxID=1448308 RepID=A0A2T2NNX0_CORCC|nr:hypothetical protein BS50DRAFT_610358 [Corynespora cassiicola Philippines]
MARVVVVPLRGGSDGDPTHVPKGQGHTIVDPPTIYLEKIAKLWMEDRGEAQPDINYILEKLPQGYVLYQKQRGKGPKAADKWLYGHPSHRYFDSPNRFFPHFKYMMENSGDTMGCPCTVCNAKKGIIPNIGASRRSSTTSISRRASPAVDPVKPPSNISAMGSTKPSKGTVGRPKINHPPAGLDTSRVDEEGTPDVYRNLIEKTRRQISIDEPITEPLSLDWRAEQAILPGLLAKYEQEQQFIPRSGDIVLFVRELLTNVDIRLEETSGSYRIYNRERKTFGVFPLWEAGIIGQPPAETVVMDDVVEETNKELNVTWSGVRVEPIPHPNEDDKSLSMRHRYVPLRQVRPFLLWKQYMHGIPEDEWHQTIKNALALMSTISLVGKYRFRGTWPEAFIYCHGMFIGSEMIAVGDTVRLLPKTGFTTSTDIMVIKTIRLKHSNLDLASSNDYDDGRPYNSAVYVYGAAFTTDEARAEKGYPASSSICTLEGYGPFYPLHAPGKEMAVPYARLLSRVYEAPAMKLWLGESVVDLDTGREGVVEAREYAREHDHRIAEEMDATWYWADSRSEALDLHTVNGLEVSKYDSMRDTRELRQASKILERQAAEGRKRTRSAVDLSSDEEQDDEAEEDEIRREMRIVEHHASPEKKKSNVEIVIEGSRSRAARRVDSEVRP